MEFYKVTKDDLYDTSKNVYPLSAARGVFMYLLYESREHKIYEIQEMFGYSNRRTIEIRIATVSSSVKKGNDKLAEDVKKIQESLNSKIK